MLAAEPETALLRGIYGHMSFPDSLDALIRDGTVVWGFLSAVVIVLIATPLVERLAHAIGALDEPTDRPRVHQRPVPRIGGLAILAGICIPAFVSVAGDGPYTGILIGTLAIGAVGLVDDIWGLSPLAKILAVAAIALIPVVGYDLTFDHFTLPVIGNHDIGWAAYPLTVLWIVALANLVNLIDGMDALAAGIVAIAAGSFAILAASFDRMDAAALAAIVCGSTLAFLPRNYHPARIFMGDSGALALGFILATMAVQGVLKTAATIALAGPLLVMAVPILDTSFVVLKRLKYRRPPWGADHNHFYHRFMRIGFSQRRAAAYLHLWAILLAAFAIFARFVPPRPHGVWDTRNALLVAGFGLVVLAASMWMIYTLEILKARHLRVLGFKRFSDSEAEGEEEAVEEVLSAQP
jgi:UDP-GlcNAc:undecaprenyl-phosphate GlcNAc-1-phosphate transferase